MIVGIGVDIIEIARMREAVSRPAFVRRVFTEQEQKYCEERSAGRFASYAARFAAKEALMKALGTGLTGGGTWHDAEVVSGEGGRPEAVLHGYFAAVAEGLRVERIYLSLSHAQEYAVAQAILWGRS